MINREEFENLKSEYYELRGWDITSGFQTKAKLKELEMEDIARDLEGSGLLK
jgi:aldehyde:ferredoxin oxidoreductase